MSEEREETITFSIRIPVSLDAKIRALAEADLQSRNALINDILEKYTDDYRYLAVKKFVGGTKNDE